MKKALFNELSSSGISIVEDVLKMPNWGQSFSTMDQIAVPCLSLREAESCRCKLVANSNLLQWIHTHGSPSIMRFCTRPRCLIHGHSSAERLSASLSNAGTLSMHRQTRRVLTDLCLMLDLGALHQCVVCWCVCVLARGNEWRAMWRSSQTVWMMCSLEMSPFNVSYCSAAKLCGNRVLGFK